MSPVVRGSKSALLPPASLERLRLLLEKMESLGLSSTKLLRQCNLSFSLDDLERGRVDTMPLMAFARVCEQCTFEIKRYGAPGYEILSRNDFDFMCHALISSTSLREVIQRMVHFFDIFDGRHGRLLMEEKETEIEIAMFVGPAESWWEIYFLASSFAVCPFLFEWITGESIPMRFQVKCAASDEALRITELFGVQVEFLCDKNKIVFPSLHLEKPVVRTVQELRQLLHLFPYSVPLSTVAPLSTRVASLYESALINGRQLPDLVQLARRMGMANATFRRQLTAEGNSIRLIKDRVRTDVALKLLATEDVDLDHVATMLGFGSSKAFSRAFTSWRGVTPLAYRRQVCGNC